MWKIGEDVNILLQGMDCFCLLFMFEGYPISLLKAQTSGLKCIVSDYVTNNVEFYRWKSIFG